MPDYRAIECPRCEAPAGEWCRNLRHPTIRSTVVHSARVYLFNETIGIDGRAVTLETCPDGCGGGWSRVPGTMNVYVDDHTLDCPRFA